MTREHPGGFRERTEGAPPAGKDMSKTPKLEGRGILGDQLETTVGKDAQGKGRDPSDRTTSEYQDEGQRGVKASILKP